MAEAARRTERVRAHYSPRATAIAGSTCLLLMDRQLDTPKPQGTSGTLMPSGVAPADSSIDYNFDAGESKGELTDRRFVHWNEYEGPYFTT